MRFLITSLGLQHKLFHFTIVSATVYLNRDINEKIIYRFGNKNQHLISKSKKVKRKFGHFMKKNDATYSCIKYVY